MEISKKGRIFEPNEQRDWIQTHASVPFAHHLDGDRYRIFFGSRNEFNHTQPGYIDIDITSPHEILSISDDPVLETGDVGTFDDSAIWPSWIIERDHSLYLYYNGWIVGENVPYYSTTGLAKSEDGGESFSRVGSGPVLGKSTVDPYITGGPCVHIEGDTWKMWYLSAVDFQQEEQGPMYYYKIKYAESTDGVHWNPRDIVCIDFQYPNETRIARPCVQKQDDGYEMWYCYAIGHDGYSIGYATSDNGIDWERKDDKVDMSVSDSGWDSEMIAYPHVFSHNGHTYMLYNGNNYGGSGFGLATIEY